MDILKFRYLVLGILIGSVLACVKTDGAYVIEPDARFNFDAFYTSVASWPYVLDAESVERFTRRYRDLSVGMKPDAVRGLLGSPDVINRTYKESERHSVVYSWLYIFRMSEPLTQGGTVVSGVALHFGSSLELFAAIPEGIEELQPIGTTNNIGDRRFTTF